MTREQQNQWEFGDLFEQKAEQVPTKKVYTVSEINRRAKNLLEDQLGDVWVEGEVSGLRRQASGHCYFAIKDESGQISCTLFRGTSSEAKSHLKDGAMVLIQGEVTLYEARGQYQMIVRKLELQGRGALQINFEKLKAKLDDEGLFAAERKKKLPQFPARIGVITSPTGAALRDVVHVIQRRDPSLELVLAPCRVQGDGASAEMGMAIKQLNRWSAKSGNRLDLVLLTRGGGSLEDLWGFNEESLARAIASSTLPVVSAVGHEIDFMISDFAADVRAATPSAAAELITEGVFASRDFVARSTCRLERLASDKLSLAKRELGHAIHRLGQAHPRRQLLLSTQRLDDLSAELQRLAKRSLESKTYRLDQVCRDLDVLRPDAVVQRHLEQLSRLLDRLVGLSQRQLQTRRARLEKRLAQLRLLSPDCILSRGYTITSDANSGAIIRKSSDIAVGQKMTTRTAAGGISSIVESIED